MKKHAKKKGTKKPSAMMMGKPPSAHEEMPMKKGMRSYAANRKMMKAY